MLAIECKSFIGYTWILAAVDNQIRGIFIIARFNGGACGIDHIIAKSTHAHGHDPCTALAENLLIAGTNAAGVVRLAQRRVWI